MRKNFKILGAVAVAGVVAATGSAFTAANTGVDDAFVGYDSATITGVSVTNIEYVVDAADASKLSSIVFTETEDVSAGYDAVLTINGPTATGASRIDCTPTYDSVAAAGTITCSTTGQTVAGVTSIGLTVAAV